MELNKIIQHNVLDPWPIPDKSVNCIVTSPPYFGLRDYNVSGQLGLEKTSEEFIANMLTVFREARRVLRDDGTLWLNIGDSYASSGGKRTHAQAMAKSGLEGGKGYRKGASDGIKIKDLFGIPWMLAFALRADGWYLRQDIIWHKTCGLPESVEDRCGKAHEYIFLLSKSSRYYFDAASIKQPSADSTILRNLQDISNQTGSQKQPGRNGKPMKAVGAKDGMVNKRSVWSVPVGSFDGAHFAVFPPNLIVDCIKAGCPPGGTVLDPFMGSGTTGLVAAKQGRNFLGLELNPEYIVMAEKRLQTELGLFR
jgi:DNA modification methylase